MSTLRRLLAVFQATRAAPLAGWVWEPERYVDDPHAGWRPMTDEEAGVQRARAAALDAAFAPNHNQHREVA